MYTKQEIETLKLKVYDKLMNVIDEYINTNHYSKSPDVNKSSCEYYKELFESLYSASAIIRDHEVVLFPLKQIIFDMRDLVFGKCKFGNFSNEWFDANPNLRFYQRKFDSTWKKFECGHFPKKQELDKMNHEFFVYIDNHKEDNHTINRDKCFVKEWKIGLRNMTIRLFLPRVIWDKDLYCRKEESNLIWYDREKVPGKYETICNVLLDNKEEYEYLYDGLWSQFNGGKTSLDFYRNLWDFRIEEKENATISPLVFQHKVRMEEDAICRFPKSFEFYLNENTSFRNDWECKKIAVEKEALKKEENGSKVINHRVYLDNYCKTVMNHVSNKELWTQFAELTESAANLVLVPARNRIIFEAKLKNEFDISQRLSCLKNNHITGEMQQSDFNRYVNAMFLWDYVTSDQNTYNIKDCACQVEDIESWLNETVKRLKKRAVFMEAMAKIIQVGEYKDIGICGKKVYRTICEKVLFTDETYEGYEDVFGEIFNKVLCYNLSFFSEFYDSAYYITAISDLSGISCLRKIYNILEKAEDAIRCLDKDCHMVDFINQTFCESSEEIL